MRTKFCHTFKRALWIGFSFHFDEMGTKAALNSFLEFYVLCISTWGLGAVLDIPLLDYKGKTVRVDLSPVTILTKAKLNVRHLHSYLLLTELRKTWQRNKLGACFFRLTKSPGKPAMCKTSSTITTLLSILTRPSRVLFNSFIVVVFHKRKPFHFRNPTDMKYFSNKFISFQEQLESLGVYFNFYVLLCTWKFIHFKLFICCRELYRF